MHTRIQPVIRKKDIDNFRSQSEDSLGDSFSDYPPSITYEVISQRGSEDIDIGKLFLFTTGVSPAANFTVAFNATITGIVLT